MSKHKKENEELEEDISIEEEPEEENSFSGSSKKLRDKLKKCVSEKQEYLEGWQRAKADFINYKKGEEKRIESVRRFANEGLIKDLLIVLDSFESAKSSKFWEKAEDEWKEGIESIIKQMESILGGHGLEKIKETKNFDPNLHESVEMIPAEKEEEDGKIDEIIQSGYKLNNKVLRPSKVKVKIFKE